MLIVDEQLKSNKQKNIIYKCRASLSLGEGMRVRQNKQF